MTKLAVLLRSSLFILLITCASQSQARSQNQKVTISVNAETLQHVFKEIKKQTGLIVFYSDALINDKEKTSINVKDESLASVLDRIIANKPLRYEIQEKYIVISAKVESKATTPDLSPALLTPPPIDVHGTVKDESGKPVAGVNISIKGGKVVGVTDDKGEFRLSNLPDNTTLVFSAVTIETFETKLNGRTELVFNAKTKVSVLNEVIVNKGYYSTSQRLNTGNVSTVTAETISKQSIDNPLQAMQGRVPGVEIIQQTGVPGGSFKVQIRGRNSINTAVANDPLYIIDGVPYPSNGISSNASQGILTALGANPLSFINPYDIESIAVLKDADATSIYGSRGANGVILITTKKGKAGDTKVSAGFSQGFSQVAHHMDLLNTPEYIQMRKEAFKNDGLTPSVTDYDINGTWDQNKYTDWQKKLIGGVAQTTNATLDISGGNEKSKYFLGGNYYNEGTVFPGDFGFKRASIHTSLNLGSPNDKLNASFTANYSHTESNLMRSDLTYLIYLAPNAPDPYDQYGKLNWSNNTVYANPMSLLLNTNNSGTDNLGGNFLISYKILKNLIFKTSLGYESIKREEIAKTPLASMAPAFTPTASQRVADFTNTYNNTLNVEPQLTYQTKFGQGNLDALIGTSFQNTTAQIRTIRGSNFNSDDLLDNIGSASLLTNRQISYFQYRYTAVFARVNYSLADKYVLNLTARRDGSSRFGDGKQFANFGAIGAAWVFSDENFIKDKLPFLSFGKIRASYGVTGNDQIPNYGYLQLWSSAGTYQGISTISPNRIANPNYSWETNNKVEVALQLAFLKDKINLEVAYYRNQSSNQLVGFPLPLSSGFQSIQANLPATVQNRGWEFTANFKIINTEDWQWSNSFNLSIPKNKLLSYPGGVENSSYSLNYITGQPLSIREIYNVIGVNSQTGLYDIEDRNGNGTLDNADRYLHKFLGQYYYGGLQNSIRFKQFVLDFLLSFNKQTGVNYMAGTSNAGYWDYSLPTSNQPSIVLGRWQNSGDQSVIQKYSTLSASNTQFLLAKDMGGEDITNASFIRLKNLSISYNLPDKWLHRLKISNAKISLQGQNIFTITKYIGLDPESQSMFQLPPLRTLTMGINLTF